MESGPQKCEARTEEQSSKQKNELYNRSENSTYTEMGACTRKHKAQIKFDENHDLGFKKQDMTTGVVHSVPLKNGRHQEAKIAAEDESKATEAFHKNSHCVFSDGGHTWKTKSNYDSDPPLKKLAESRGSESSLYSKVSTCTSLNPVLENAMESASDSNEVSRISRESSPRESMDEALKSEKAFIEYVMSLPSSLSLLPKEASGTDGTTKTKQKQVAPVLTSTTKVGLDHLDNLCKLMEQLSELKETNSKLQKRVQYLEDLKTLHDMHKEIRQDSQYGSENVLMRKKHMGLKKSITGGDYVKHSPRCSEDFTQLTGEAETNTTSTTSKEQKQSIHRGRTQNSTAFDGARRERSKSVGHEDAFDGKSRRIFPKWSKVKEALGWERPLPEDNAKQQQLNYSTDLKETGSKSKPSVKYRDSGSSAFFKGNRRVFTEDYVANLGIPYYSDYPEKEEESPSAESLAGCDLWKHNANFHSSSEDIDRLVDAYHTRRGTCKRDSDSSAKRISLLEPPSDGIRRQKSTPSPGSDRCRTYNEMLDLKPKSLTIERDIDAEQAFAKFDKEDGKKSHKSPWGRVKTIIERRRDSLKRRHGRRGPEPEPSSPMQARDMEMAYTTHSMDDLDYQSNEGLYQRKSSDEHLLMHTRHSDSFQKNIRDDAEVDKNRRKCRPESSHWKEKEEEEHQERNSSSLRCPKSASNQNAPQFYDVLPTDNRCVSGSAGDYPTPSSSPQFHRKSRWLRMKNALRGKKEDEGAEPSSLSMPASPNDVHEAATFDFEENEGLYGHCREVENCPHPREMPRVGSDSFVHKLSLSSSVPISDIMLELQRNLSEDFNRKIIEWERIRSLGGARTTSPKWDRKNSEPKSRSKKQEKSKPERIEKTTKPKIKDLSWLEKELQKIEKEKLRLSKEKEKYEERAIRLERLRQTVLNANNTNKKEVLVRTSAGEFRFEGISDAFTKKLYEWETKRGVCPELSTIALLDSSLGTTSKPTFNIQQADKCSLLHRAMSRSESSLPEMGQPSHTSSNSLPSLKPPDAGDMERVHLQSRASSEPDLTSLSAIANSSNNRNGHCLTSFENVSVADVFQTEDNSRASLCDLEKNPNESYTPLEDTQLIDGYAEGGASEERRDETETEQREENYYSLLEENVILLDQLKKKEDICRRLENELELLDEKVDEMNSHHQKEMERYREKLWEMHRPGTTPREAQGCLQIISELRTRIEELEKCSERLRNDRDTIEDSFRYHSEQQERMTLDLMGKMRELQAAGGSPVPESAQADDSEYKRSKRKLLPILDMKLVEKLQSLSAQLVKQTTNLENTLAERTRQICQLRWELLHRDVSTVKLETELHTAHIQGVQRPYRAKCEAKRSKYAHFRSWSSEEASSRAKQEERYPEFDRLIHQSQEMYSHIPKSEFQATDLSSTVHELSKELLRLSTAAESLLTASEDEDQQDRMPPAKTENAVQRVKPSESEIEISSQALAPSTSGDSRSGIEGMQGRSRSDSICSSQITVRRNSADNISSVSGPDISETSSVNEAAEKSAATSVAVRTLSPKRRVSSSSSSAEESSEEGKFSNVSCCSGKERSIAVQGREIIPKRVTSRKDKKRVDSSKDKSCGKYGIMDKRATNSDSKIPLSSPFSIVKSGSVGSYDRDKKEAQPADRSLSTREKRELFASRREHALRRRIKPPPLEIKTAENFSERVSSNGEDKTTSAFNETGPTKNSLAEDNVCKNSATLDSRSSSSVDRNIKISHDNSSQTIVTVKLPRRKPKTAPKKVLTKNNGRQDPSCQDEKPKEKKTVEATVTVVLPKKKRCVDRQLPKRSSTDGDVRELMKRENVLELQGNISASKLTGDKHVMPSFTEHKRCLNSHGKDLQIDSFKSYPTDITECAKGDSSAPRKGTKDPELSTTSHDFAHSEKKEGKPSQEVTGECANGTSSTSVKQESFRPGYFKSPSAPQLDFKLGCTRKISREGAPNVKGLIEKYNQKAMENLPPKYPRSAPNQNSSIPVRKISAVDWRSHQQQQANIPFTQALSCSPSSSVESNAPFLHCPHEIGEASRLCTPPVSPPTSPASRARAEALHKAKENFMSANVSPIKPPMFVGKDEISKSLKNTSADSNKPSEEAQIQSYTNSVPEDDRISSCSTRSMDSTSLVVYRTGESCQESRLARKVDSDRRKIGTETVETTQMISPESSTSTPSITKTVAGYEFKLPTSLMNLKLRRSKRKKDLATVSELCRQSLFITKDEDLATENSLDANNRIKSPRSCPSSPELKSKSKPKTGWLQWSILRHK